MTKPKTGEIKEFLQKACNLETKIFATEAIIDTLSKKREYQETLKSSSFDFLWINSKEGKKYSEELEKIRNIEKEKVSDDIRDYSDSDLKDSELEKPSSKYIFLLFLPLFYFVLLIFYAIVRADTRFFMLSLVFVPLFIIIFFIFKNKNKKYLKANEDYLAAKEKMNLTIKNKEDLIQKMKDEHYKSEEIARKEAYDKLLPLVAQNVNELTKAINNQNVILESTKKDLNNLYSKNIVHAKYRGLIPITTLSEYFDTGRCYDLAGPDGAYNLYESELRQNVIISELNSIDKNLNQIKNNQFYLYTSVNVVNQSIKDLSSQIDTCTNDVISNIKTAAGAAEAIVSAVDRATARIPVWHN